MGCRSWPAVHASRARRVCRSRREGARGIRDDAPERKYLCSGWASRSPPRQYAQPSVLRMRDPAAQIGAESAPRRVAQATALRSSWARRYILASGTVIDADELGVVGSLRRLRWDTVLPPRKSTGRCPEKRNATPSQDSSQDARPCLSQPWLPACQWRGPEV